MIQVRLIGTIKEIDCLTKEIQNQNKYSLQISEKRYTAKNNQIRKYLKLSRKRKTEEI